MTPVLQIITDKICENQLNLFYLKEIMKTYRLKTMKEAINFSLKKTAEAQKRKNLLQLKGKVKWEGNLDEVRKSI
ncbi:MAG: hypothetical protein ACOCVA_00695 [Prolixibacteraceae bacterium]